MKPRTLLPGRPRLDGEGPGAGVAPYGFLHRLRRGFRAHLATSSVAAVVVLRGDVVGCVIYGIDVL